MLNDDLKNQILLICKILAKNSVEYLIVGGTALAFHGHYRMTMLSSGELSDKHDFDFWYRPSYENYYNLLRALRELGIDTTKFDEESTPNPKKSFFRHEFEDFKIDFLPEILGLEQFNTSYMNCDESEIEGVEISILSYSDLVKSKEATARKKDFDDLTELKKLNKNTGESHD
ncbi:MAG: hypothetical protein GQ564_21345 [Bacteroidales bacterium]|nr:hypothetical protein [Bacteroidales bacterium]